MLDYLDTLLGHELLHGLGGVAASAQEIGSTFKSAIFKIINLVKFNIKI